MWYRFSWYCFVTDLDCIVSYEWLYAISYGLCQIFICLILISQQMLLRWTRRITICTAILVLTESIGLAIILVILIMWLLRGRQRKWQWNKQQKSSPYRAIPIALWPVSLVICVVSLWRYQSSYHQAIQWADLISSWARVVVMSTGTIIQHATSQRYEFQLHDGSTRWLRTDESFDPGDVLFVTANVKTVSPLPTLQRSFHSLDGWSGLVWWSGIEFDYPRRLIMKGIQWDLYMQSAVVLHRDREISRLLDIRKMIGLSLDTALTQPQTSALTQWMLIGDRSRLTRDEYQMFIDSWLVHLIAVSGGNIVMLVTFLMLVLFRLPFYVRVMTILLAVIGYSLICGLDSSVLRATIMGWLSLFALMVGRQIDIWRVIQIARIVMLLLNPYLLVYDVGFLLSFSAVIGLVLLTPRMTISSDHAIKISLKKHKIWSSSFVTGVWRTMRQGLITIRNRYLVPSIAATIGVFPVLMLFMGSMNIAGILANMFVVPLIPVIMINGVLVGTLGWIVPIQLGVWIQDALVRYVFQIGIWMSQYGVYIDVYTGWMKIAIVAWFVMMVMMESNKKVLDDRV